MGFPASFLGVIRVMYTDMWARLKVNGHVGGAFRQRNGLRQGLPSSCPLWLIYIEPLVRRLRDDPQINGITIPGALGRGTVQHKVAAFADDLKCFSEGGCIELYTVYAVYCIVYSGCIRCIRYRAGGTRSVRCIACITAYTAVIQQLLIQQVIQPQCVVSPIQRVAVDFCIDVTLVTATRS